MICKGWGSLLINCQTRIPFNCGKLEMRERERDQGMNHRSNYISMGNITPNSACVCVWIRTSNFYSIRRSLWLPEITQMMLPQAQYDRKRGVSLEMMYCSSCHWIPVGVGLWKLSGKNECRFDLRNLCFPPFLLNRSSTANTTYIKKAVRFRHPKDHFRDICMDCFLF